ncbi:MAG: hypothetical protein LVR00_05775 [Rhabdochlamydiaceae bacterium]|jgi:hypothetical protein
MKSGQALFATVQLLITAVVFFTGGLFLCLPFVPHMRFKLASLFSARDALFLILGSGLLGLGIILLIGFYFMNRHSYYQLEMRHHKHTAAADVALLRSLIAIYWKQSFPEKNLSSDIVIHGKKIEVIVEVPPMGLDEQERLIENAEKEIGELLEKQVGYQREFLFTVLK